MQIHSPTVEQGSGGGRGGWGWAVLWMEALPGVFDMLQYYEAILPLVESL